MELKNTYLFYYLVTISFFSIRQELIAQSPTAYNYRTSDEIILDYNKNNLTESQAAQELSLIGNAAFYYEPSGNLLEGFENNEALERISAKEYILEKAKKSQIIIFNENHHIPQNRAFVTSLLDSLVKLGFKYIALEAITNHFEDEDAFLFDLELTSRGYPLSTLVTGTYTREPQMGQLLRKAIKLDMEILGYENIHGENREKGQADNINRKVFINNPDAKLIILCGHYHVFENPKEGKSWMAHELKMITGIDPLTIFQVDYQLEIHDQLTCSLEPYILKFPKDDRSIDENLFDIAVYHPPITYIKGRPSWIIKNNWKHIDINEIVDLSELDITYPFIAKVYLENEPLNATPIDIIEVKSDLFENTLYIEKSKNYILKLFSEEKIYPFTVK